MHSISIAKDFSITPGARYRREGKWSGEEFYEDILLPAFIAAQQAGVKLMIDLDGTSGYATSFLEQAFGTLAIKFGIDEVQDRLSFKTIDEPLLEEEIDEYITHAASTQ